MILPDNVHVLPEMAIVRSLMTILRNRRTPSDQFRPAVLHLARLTVACAVEEEPIDVIQIQTPLEEAEGYRFRRGRAAVVPILRAGNAFLDPFAEALPNPKFWHLGLGRNHETLQPRQYSCSVPKRIGSRTDTVYIADPMFATGGSAKFAADLIKARGARKVVYVGLVGVPQAIDLMQTHHPDVPIYLASIEDGLNPRGYIWGKAIGDCGDRLNNSFP